MSLMLDDLAPEQVPLTGVFQSFNGSVFLGDFEIFRVSDAIIRTSNNPATYPEVGSRYPIPYRRQTTVAGNMRRAFVNLFEWALAIGIPANDANYVAGMVYEANELSPGATTPLKTISNQLLAGVNPLGNEGATKATFNRPVNYYPIKTTMEFEINKDEIITDNVSATQVNAGGAVTALTAKSSYLQSMKVFGVMIDTMQLSIGAAGELITSGPFDWVGEAYRYKVTDQRA